MQQTYAIFQHHIKESSHERNLPEVLVAAQEFADLTYSSKDIVRAPNRCPAFLSPASAV